MRFLRRPGGRDLDPASASAPAPEELLDELESSLSAGDTPAAIKKLAEITIARI